MKLNTPKGIRSSPTTHYAQSGQTTYNIIESFINHTQPYIVKVSTHKKMVQCVLIYVQKEK